jgi:hypothetical protein
VLYFVHALYWRDGFRFMGSVWGSSSCGRRFLGEVLQVSHLRSNAKPPENPLALSSLFLDTLLLFAIRVFV